jgi:hypothetical protein
MVKPVYPLQTCQSSSKKTASSTHVFQNVLKCYHQLTGEERRVPFIFFLNELYEYCLNLQFQQKLILEIISTSRDAKIGKPLLLSLASREVNITFQRLTYNSFVLQTDLYIYTFLRYCFHIDQLPSR